MHTVVVGTRCAVMYDLKHSGKEVQWALGEVEDGGCGAKNSKPRLAPAGYIFN